MKKIKNIFPSASYPRATIVVPIDIIQDWSCSTEDHRLQKTEE